MRAVLANAVKRRWPRGWLGHLTPLALGALLLLGCEGALRLFGVAEPPPLVRELARLDDQILYTINPGYPRRFFHGVAESSAGVRMASRPFVESDGEDIFRVVFVGGSTVVGFPHPKRLAAASYLQAMLEDLWPQRRVEVFNLGITAVASYAVAQCVEAAAVLRPDLMVVYTGHNEFYGVYGAASLQRGGSSIWAKDWHYDLMQWRLAGLMRSLLGGASPKAPSASLVQVMVAAGTVPLEDPRRQRAALNLAENLKDMADFCQRRQIPLVLCTLASNMTGFAPEATEPVGLGPGQMQVWKAKMEQAQSLAMAAKAPQEALGLLEEAAQLWDGSGRLKFIRGHLLQQLGQHAGARREFALALDWDTVPFRAPTAFNEVIRRVAAEKNCLLADVHAAFERASPVAGTGWNLMDDHLHPSAAGQLLLARTIVAALTSEVNADTRLERLRSNDEYRRLMEDLPVERLRVSQAMARLLSEAPLERGYGLRVDHLIEASQAHWELLLPTEQIGYKRWQSRKVDQLLTLNVADQLFVAGEWQAAKRYYRATQLESPFTIQGDVWATLRWARCSELLDGELLPSEIMAVEETERRARFLAQGSDAAPALFDLFSGYARHLVGDSSQALIHLEKAAADKEVRHAFFFDLLWLLCEELVAHNRHGAAERYVRQISAEVGQDEFGRQLLGWLAQRRA